MVYACGTQGSVEVVYPTADSSADTETQLAQAAGGFSTSAAPGPHSLSSMHPQDLIPQQVGPACDSPSSECRGALPQSRRDVVCLPLLADPVRVPILVERSRAPGDPGCSSLWVDLCWDHPDSSGRIWSYHSSPAPGHPWFWSVSFPKVPGHLRRTDPFLKEGKNTQLRGDADASLRTWNLHNIRHSDSCQRRVFCGLQLLHMEADDNFTAQPFSSRWTNASV